jgi:cell division septation protein DedD
LAVAIIAIVRGVVGSIRISVVTEPQAADETIAAIMETLMPLAKAIVHTREAAVKSAKFPTMESANSGTVEATKSAAVKPAAESAAMETAAPAMETSAPTPAPAMPSVGEIWLAERGSAQQSSCDRQSLSVLRPGPIFV